MTTPSQLLEVCRQAARAGRQVLRDWQGKAQVWEKGPADLVTQADLAAQREIERIVVDHFPDHAFVGEESGKSAIEFRPGKLCWIVDPLDGTTNYVHGLPGYAVSVAVADGEEVLAGNVFDAMMARNLGRVRGASSRPARKSCGTNVIARNFVHSLAVSSTSATALPTSRSTRATC